MKSLKRSSYYNGILEEFIPKPYSSILIDNSIKTMDGISLGITEFHSNSKIGIVISPGLTVPRESYFKLIANLLEYNVVAYDPRGQGSSDGQIDYEKCSNDINLIGSYFRQKRNLSHLIGIGHSFGGLTLLESSLLGNHPYNLRISIAAPIDLSKVAKSIPRPGSVIFIYFYNLLRLIKKPALRDDIVTHHQHLLPIPFFNNPRIVSLSIKNPGSYNKLLYQSSNLINILYNAPKPSHLIYAGNDERLGIQSRSDKYFLDLHNIAINMGFNITFFEGLTHRFNFPIEERFVFSYNNFLVINEIKNIIYNFTKH